MLEKNQTPIEMLDQNAAVVQSAEVPAPAAPIQLQQRQSYAEKVQGLTVDERNWMLAKSKAAAMAQLSAGFLPQTYTGNPGACAIACEMALRMGVSHLFVMQNLYVVHGMPTWSGKSCKALIDNSGQFAGRTRYRMEGEEGTDNWGCRLIGVDKLTGEKVEGPKVTVKMAKDAGWWDKNGSYWPKMTEMMLMHLQSTNCITSKTGPRYSVIAINNYTEIIGSTKQSTSNQPTPNQDLTKITKKTRQSSSACATPEPTPTKTTSPVVMEFEQRICKLSTQGKAQLTGYADRLGEELVLAIISRCADLGAYSWVYVRKALAEAEAQGCKSVEEYRRLHPIGSGRNLRVDRTEPSGNDFLKNAGRRRPLKKKGDFPKDN